MKVQIVLHLLQKYQIMVLDFKEEKMIKNILTISALSLLLVNCGGSGGTKDRVMEKGELYTVSKGDVIVKASEEATVKVTHVSGKDSSTVSLVDGNATITHPKEQ